MDLLRFATAGSVDDGKSTMIGRLLYDSKAIFTDQLESVERTSRERGDEYTDLALLTDGLRAEREQGITIDVAYRYFATPRRKFIIADTPGHIQYTRNMVTGASTADLAVVLVDARKGIDRAEPAACLHRLAAAGPAPGARRQQDGPGRLVAEGLRRDRGRVHQLRRQAGDRRSHDHPHLGTARGQHRRPGPRPCPGTRGRRCCTISNTCTSPATATSSTCGSRCSTSSGPNRTTMSTTAGTRARSPAECSSRATRSWSCPADSRPDRCDHDGRRTGRRGVPTDVGDDPPRGRDRRLPRGHDLPAAQPTDDRAEPRRDGLLDDGQAPAARAPSSRSSTPLGRCGLWSRSSSTASTSTRCIGTRPRTNSA